MKLTVNELRKLAYLERTASEHLKCLSQEDAQEMALKLDKSSLEKLILAENLRIQSRLDSLSVYPVEMVKRVRKGRSKTYTYWYASWRMDRKVKNIYLGPADKMSREEAFIKARMLKAKDLDIDL